MGVDWHREITDQLDWYWQQLFRPRLAGLTDEEYFWEPVDGCWTVRPADGRTFVPDWQWPAPTPAPVTTIAWRMCHIGGPVLGIRANAHFGYSALTVENIAWPGTAADAIAFVADSYAAWKTGIDALDDGGLAAPIGPAEGPFADEPFAALIMHINREVIHHGAEVALLRDLYRACGGRRL